MYIYPKIWCIWLIVFKLELVLEEKKDYKRGHKDTKVTAKTYKDKTM